MDFSTRHAGLYAAKVDILMMRLCAVMVLSLLGGLVSVHAAPAPHPHWSVGFHRMTFLDPLDLQPMKAIAFYPSTGLGRGTQVKAVVVCKPKNMSIQVSNPRVEVSRQNM
jgi:hypothetical protein